MKKLLLLALTALIVAGCNEKKEVPNKSKKIDKIYHAYTCNIDSCEYIVRGHGIAHKGNCRFCKERRQKEMKELVEQLKKKI